ncbi:uncharacterized protein LOC131664324 [Phymastichus coffea]|uniref:uncharacterized protein LOC131664324 n=1 Tax=Phymastichus coffea TaxID=108790 RepID=UPI00273C898F|nr:uncharacterized protein LOC131664324 [Phymastichus coffea]XP_058791309.1 uncharacterized protein LOC131664324 [Phymastichus coffea]
MGNYSSKLFSNNVVNDNKVNEHTNSLQEPNITSNQVLQNGQTSEKPLDNEEIMQTPIKKNYLLESRKRINAIPEYLQTEKTRKPYLETDIDSVYTTEKCCLDPRSPNVAYPRTPILLQNNLDSLTKDVDSESLPKLKLPHAELKINSNDLDPRSPASDFDRTPISTVKVLKQFNSQDENNENRLRKSNSSLDICIKLSYCETTSLFNIPEIQALPDIVVSLRRSCSLKDNLNENRSSVLIGNNNIKSELISDDKKTVKLHLSSENSIPKSQKETSPSETHIEIKNENTESNEKLLIVNSTNADFENSVNTPRDVENVNKATDPEEKFKVWRDSYSKLPENPSNSHSNNSQRNSSLPEKEEILIEFDDCSIMNSIRNNQVKKIEKIETSCKENKVKSDKKNLETKKENKLSDEKKLFSPELKLATEFSKSRTPFSNRSNSNGQIQTLSVNSPQQFLGHRKLFVNDNKNLQENTPPTHKKLVKNVPARLNGTQWDSDSTIII